MGHMPWDVVLFYLAMKEEFEEAGLCGAEVKQAGSILGRGKIHGHPDTFRRNVDKCP